MESLFVRDVVVDGDTVSIRCVDGAISEMEVGLSPAAGEEVLEGSGMTAVPPMVNGHTHVAMTLFRAYGDDLPLMRWLEEMIWPAEARLTAEDVYWGARLATVEMLRSGTTSFFDMYWHSDQVARAATDAGMRVAAGQAVIDQLDSARSPALLAEAAEYLDLLGEIGPLVAPCLAPHAIYTVGEESLRGLGELMRERDAVLHIHLAETSDEVEECVSRTGKRPAFYLDEVGVLGPTTVLAHGVWLDDSELELIAEREATVVSNPCANMKLAVGGSFRWQAAIERGVRLGLGTDGPSSNSNLDMFEEAKVFALLQKHSSRDPSVAPAGEVLALARGQSSPLLGGAEIRAGERADFLLLDTATPELAAGDLDSGLVYGAAGGSVDTAVVAGSVVMRDRVVPGMDEALHEVRERSAHLTATHQ